MIVDPSSPEGGVGWSRGEWRPVGSMGLGSATEGSLGLALGCVTLDQSASSGGVGWSYPYLIRRNDIEFVYGQHEALGEMLGCEFAA